eukprot:3107646-Rhodomonas_salina.1
MIAPNVDGAGSVQDKAKMRESAEFFEELATKVQSFSMEEDYMLGISVLLDHASLRFAFRGLRAQRVPTCSPHVH